MVVESKVSQWETKSKKIGAGEWASREQIFSLEFKSSIKEICFSMYLIGLLAELRFISDTQGYLSSSADSIVPLALYIL